MLSLGVLILGVLERVASFCYTVTRERRDAGAGKAMRIVSSEPAEFSSE